MPYKEDRSYNEYQKQWNEKNKEKIKQRKREYNQRNKDKIKKVNALYRERNRERLSQLQKEYNKAHKPQRMNSHWKSKGIITSAGLFFTYKDYEKALSENNNSCELCGRHITERRLVVDHNHETGFFRGIICMDCNTGISYFQDQPENIENAIRYLKERETQI